MDFAWDGKNSLFHFFKSDLTTESNSHNVETKLKNIINLKLQQFGI